MDEKFKVAGAVVGMFLVAGAGMAVIKKQFFPTSDRPEVLAEVQMPEGASIEFDRRCRRQGGRLAEAAARNEDRHDLYRSGRAALLLLLQSRTSRSVVRQAGCLTPDADARDRLKVRLRERVAEGLAPEAHIRVAQLVFGPYTHFPIAFRVMGPDTKKLRAIADEVQSVMRANPNTRQANQDWGARAPTVHFVLDQDRLQLIGLTSTDVAEQLQFLLTGVAATQVREDIRTVEVMARSSGSERLDPVKFGDLTLTSSSGRPIPLSQIGHVEIRPEEPILRRRDRTPTITVQCDVDEALQPPQVSTEIQAALAPIIARLPDQYRIETGGNIEESTKANSALVPVFPIMIALTLLVIVLQVRSLPAMGMVFLTPPLGLLGTVPILLLFGRPFGFTRSLD